MRQTRIPRHPYFKGNSATSECHQSHALPADRIPPNTAVANNINQETKIQEKDVEALRAQDILPGYASEWSCSQTKLGYSGTAVFFTKQSDPWKGDGGGIDATGNGLPSDEPVNLYLLPNLSPQTASRIPCRGGALPFLPIPVHLTSTTSLEPSLAVRDVVLFLPVSVDPL